jgi:hypothetical protein
VPPRTKTTIATKRALVTIFFIGTKLPAFDVIPREMKFSQNYFRVILIPESSRENTNARPRVGNNVLLVAMSSPMCHMHTKIGRISAERQ